MPESRNTPPLPDQFRSVLKSRQQLKAAVADAVATGDLARSHELRGRLQANLREIQDSIDPDQITLRRRLAEEHGFTFVGKFSNEGYSRAEVAEREWYLIDKTGKKVRDKKYVKLSDFSEGRAAMADENGAGFISYELEELPQRFEWVGDFHEGYAAVYQQEKFGFVNFRGEYLMRSGHNEPLKGDDFGNFNEGIGGITIQNTSFLIDQGGRFCSAGYRWLGLCWEGKVEAETLDGKFIFIGKNGLMLFNETYEGTKEFSDGIGGVKKEGKWYFINGDGEKIFEQGFDDIGYFDEGIAPVSIGGYWWYINTQDKAVFCEANDPTTTRTFDSAQSFKEGMAVVGVGDKYFAINKQGNIVTPDGYDVINDFEDGVAGVRQGNTLFYIDKRGQQLFKEGAL